METTQNLQNIAFGIGQRELSHFTRNTYEPTDFFLIQVLNARAQIDGSVKGTLSKQLMRYHVLHQRGINSTLQFLIRIEYITDNIVVYLAFESIFFLFS